MAMPKRNYQKEMEQVLERLPCGGEPKTLLLHACCAPCSSYVLEYLSSHFAITVFYYNPNISPREEYEKRVREEMRLIREMPVKYPVHFLEGTYDPERYRKLIRGHEDDPEGGNRCGICFSLRLEEAAKAAKAGGFDYFTTSLTISPLKNAARLNTIGEAMGKQYGVAFLNSDFKKREGYHRSIELSREYGLYRQDFCGCVYSRREAEARRAARDAAAAGTAAEAPRRHSSGCWDIPGAPAFLRKPGCAAGSAGTERTDGNDQSSGF